MKAKTSFGIFVLFLISLVIILSMVNFSPSLASTPLAGASSATIQVSPTPVGEAGASEVGSTDGILILGVVIILIVTIPLFFYNPNRKR